METYSGTRSYQKPQKLWMSMTETYEESHLHSYVINEYMILHMTSRDT